MYDSTNTSDSKMDIINECGANIEATNKSGASFNLKNKSGERIDTTIEASYNGHNKQKWLKY